MPVERIPRVLEIFLLHLTRGIDLSLASTRQRLNSATHLLHAVDSRFLGDLADSHEGYGDRTHSRGQAPRCSHRKAGSSLGTQLADSCQISVSVPLLLNKAVMVDIALQDLAEAA